MSNLKEFNFLNEFESDIVKKTLDEIKTNSFETIKNNKYNFLISKFKEVNKYPEIYAIPTKILNLFKDINRKNDPKIISVGIYFGYLKRGKLILSIEAAEFLNEYNLFPKRKQIILNEKGEKSILYGNEITGEDILIIPNNIQRGDLLLVLNKEKNVLALSTALIDTDKIKSEKTQKVALNLVDKGYYLRRQE
jgi:ribosome biogenesis protein Nip4